MGILDALKKSADVSDQKCSEPLAEREIEAKLGEIDGAIANLFEQQEQIDKLIEERIDKILEEKLQVHKIQQTVNEYKSQNDNFIRDLRNNVHANYKSFIDDNIRILQKAKERLQTLKEFQLQ